MCYLHFINYASVLPTINAQYVYNPCQGEWYSLCNALLAALELGSMMSVSRILHDYLPSCILSDWHSLMAAMQLLNTCKAHKKRFIYFFCLAWGAHLDKDQCAVGLLESCKNVAAAEIFLSSEQPGDIDEPDSLQPVLSLISPRFYSFFSSDPAGDVDYVLWCKLSSQLFCALCVFCTCSRVEQYLNYLTQSGTQNTEELFDMGLRNAFVFSPVDLAVRKFLVKKFILSSTTSFQYV